MNDDQPIVLGTMGTAEENAAYMRWRESQLKENARRIDQQQCGDIPDALTDEDEAILDRISKEIAQKDERRRLRNTTARKRRVCPACGSRNTARILYGEIILTEKLHEQSQKGKLVFGGCCESNDSPDRHCKDCDTSFSARAA